jgi:monoamine oxidase
MQALTAALKSQIPAEKIKTGHQVVAVSRAGKEVQVHTRSEGSKKPYFPVSMSSSLPPALAAKIDFRPAMPEQVLSNWRKIPTWMAPHAKYVAVYKTDLLHAAAFRECRKPRGANGCRSMTYPSQIRAKRRFLVLLAYRQNRDGLSAKLFSKAFAGSSSYAYLGRMRQPEAEYIKDWAADPFTATEFDLLQEVGHAMPEQLPGVEWSGEITGVASEWSPQFSGYLAGAIDSALTGVQRWLQQK